MSMTSDGLIASMRQPASFARARTTKVLPVPGGPKRRHPVMLCSFSRPCWNAAGWSNGSETIVRTESMVCSGKCTWPKVVVREAKERISDDV